jgi:hypothetical protein
MDPAESGGNDAESGLDYSARPDHNLFQRQEKLYATTRQSLQSPVVCGVDSTAGFDPQGDQVSTRFGQVISTRSGRRLHQGRFWLTCRRKW